MITNTKNVHEVIELASKEKDIKKKIAILQENASNALRDVICGVYDKNIKWAVPNTPPPYIANTIASTPSNLLKEYVDFIYIVEGCHRDLPQYKRENKLIGMLESIHAEDAELIVNHVLPKKPITGVPRSVCKKAFPGLQGI